MSALNEQEKERIRYHMGYMETSYAASVQFGLARPIQTMFILDQAMGLLTNPFALDRARRVLDTLDNLECQLQAAVKTTMVSNMGTMNLHPLAAQGKLATDSIEREYVRWARRLADILGAPLYPYSARFVTGGPGSSVRVR